MIHKLLFEVVDGAIYLHISETVIIPFRNIDEWRTFANQMLDMIPEITENL
jgi:hypothetical protein